MKLPTLAYALICSFAAAAVAQQPQKAGPASQPQLEERVKKLEDRADNADVQTKKAALDTDYIQRVQKQYETYYEKVLSTQATVFSVVGILLTIGLFIAARFSFNVFERLTKSALAEATAELRKDYARALATEVQKLKDANATDIEKLKNALTSKIETLEADLKSRTDLQIGFVQGRISCR